MVFRNLCFRQINFPGFHKWKQCFGQSVWNMTYRNPLLIRFFTCFSIWLFVFLFRHYHDSMTAIFILCLEFLFQFFVDPGLLIIYMIPFYSWFNRCNCDKSHFFFFFALILSCFYNIHHCLLNVLRCHWKVLCWNINVCCWVSNTKSLFDAMCQFECAREFKMPPTKRRSFCKEFKLKVTNWYFEKGKNINQTTSNFQIDWKQVWNWLKDEERIYSLKLLKKGMPISKVFSHGKATLHEVSWYAK